MISVLLCLVFTQGSEIYVTLEPSHMHFTAYGFIEANVFFFLIFIMQEREFLHFVLMSLTFCFVRTGCHRCHKQPHIQQRVTEGQRSSCPFNSRESRAPLKAATGSSVYCGHWIHLMSSLLAPRHCHMSCFYISETNIAVQHGLCSLVPLTSYLWLFYKARSNTQQHFSTLPLTAVWLECMCSPEFVTDTCLACSYDLFELICLKLTRLWFMFFCAWRNLSNQREGNI